MDDRTTAPSDIPLIVDLDGTLCKVDTLHEALIQLIARKPIRALQSLLIAPTQGRAAFKAAVADHVLPDVGTMPFDDAVMAAISEAKAKGRKVYLATAADHRVADAVAHSLSLDGVFASKDGINLKGQEKADRLVAAFGKAGFDYIGNDRSDTPVWRMARTALVCGASPRFIQRLKGEFPGLIDLSTRRRKPLTYLSALRPHQWLKNGLIILPALSAHNFTTGVILAVLMALASFSLAASGVYLVNDMIDLPHDRAHAHKRHRSLAAGRIPLTHAVVLCALVAVVSLAIALALPAEFMFTLLAYVGASIAYSVYLKRKLMIDVVALAGLYGIRVLAGSAATGIFLSHWLVGFCLFIFLSLALVKRMAEMIALPATVSENVKGRGYRREDLQTINGLASASGFVAVLVLALYINSNEVSALYHHPQLLWGICVVLVYWLGRVYVLTGRGEMHQDPVIFAATDRISLLTALVVLIVFLVAL
jgi:4-hydroxybenzoate polyprenyltransferase/phosphoserine phosphatase